MTEIANKYFEAIKDIVEKTSGLKYETISTVKYAKEHKVDNHFFIGLEELGIVSIKRQGRSILVKSKMKPSQIEPFHAVDLLKRLNEIRQRNTNNSAPVESDHPMLNENVE